MRKFFRSITNLSLLQQLSVIIFTFGFVLILFFSVYLRHNINQFVDSQVMNILTISQNKVINIVESQSSGGRAVGADADVMHFVFNRDRLALSVYEGTFDNDFIEEVGKISATIGEEEIQGIVVIQNQSYYYLGTRIDNNRTIVSMIAASYGMQMESTLLTNISNTTAIAIMLVFLLVMLWTFSIITPLQQIRTYINKARKGEEAVLKINRSDEIGELAEELVSLQEELKHQEETKEEMIHNISHDLKTPIATIKSYAESIKDGIYPYDTLEKSVDVIIDNANRLEQKVYSLLFLNRLDYMMEQEQDTDKTTDMKATIETVLLSLKMIRPDVSIDCTLENTIFRGDEESWRIVIENLIDNALRYAASNITITLKPNEMTISNDGPAISEERMARLFKPFEKGTHGKFGLGLSICHKVCIAYGYNIDAENLEKGVVFRITDARTAKKESKLSKLINEAKAIESKDRL